MSEFEPEQGKVQQRMLTETTTAFAPQFYQAFWPLFPSRQC